MTPCDDCLNDNIETNEGQYKCANCHDYVNYKSRNKRTFLLIVIIPEIIIFIGLIVWRIIG